MPDFEEKFGKPLSEMDTGEKEIAYFAYFDEILARLDDLNGKTKAVPWLERTGAIALPLIIAWLIWLTKSFFGK